MSGLDTRDKCLVNVLSAVRDRAAPDSPDIALAAIQAVWGSRRVGCSCKHGFVVAAVKLEGDRFVEGQTAGERLVIPLGLSRLIRKWARSQC